MLKTNISTLDLRLGGGLPSGITEIYGKSSTGKTALASHIVKHNPEKTLWINSDQDFPEDYLARINVDLDKLDVLSEPSNMLNCILEATTSSMYNLIVVDTITNVAPSKKDWQHLGDVINEKINSISSNAVDTNTHVLILNQIRDKDKTPGGRLIKLYAKRRIQLLGSGFLRDPIFRAIGRNIKYKVHSVYGLQPYINSELYLIYNTGIDIDADAIKLGMSLNLIRKNKSWLSLITNKEEIPIGRSLNSAVEYLKQQYLWERYCCYLQQALEIHVQKPTSLIDYSALSF